MCISSEQEIKKVEFKSSAVFLEIGNQSQGIRVPSHRAEIIPAHRIDFRNTNIGIEQKLCIIESKNSRPEPIEPLSKDIKKSFNDIKTCIEKAQQKTHTMTVDSPFEIEDGQKNVVLFKKDKIIFQKKKRPCQQEYHYEDILRIMIYCTPSTRMLNISFEKQERKDSFIELKFDLNNDLFSAFNKISKALFSVDSTTTPDHVFE